MGKIVQNKACCKPYCKRNYRSVELEIFEFKTLRISRLTVQPVEHTKTGLPPGLDSSALSISSKGTTPTS